MQRAAKGAPGRPRRQRLAARGLGLLLRPPRGHPLQAALKPRSRRQRRAQAAPWRGRPGWRARRARPAGRRRPQAARAGSAPWTTGLPSMPHCIAAQQRTPTLWMHVRGKASLSEGRGLKGISSCQLPVWPAGRPAGRPAAGAPNLNHPKCEPLMKRATASGLPSCMLWTAFCCSLLIVISSMPRWLGEKNSLRCCAEAGFLSGRADGRPRHGGGHSSRLLKAGHLCNKVLTKLTILSLNPPLLARVLLHSVCGTPEQPSRG